MPRLKGRRLRRTGTSSPTTLWLRMIRSASASLTWTSAKNHDIQARTTDRIHFREHFRNEPSPHKFADIPEEIKSAVDYIVEPKLEKGATGQASQILKVGLDGEILIIRE